MSYTVKFLTNSVPAFNGDTMGKLLIVHLAALGLFLALPENIHHRALELLMLIQVHSVFEIAEKAIKKKKGDPPDSDR